MPVASSKYEAVIGLEVHVQLLTESKIFSGSSAAFGGRPNSKVDPVCMGLPGVLPVTNERAILFAVRMGLATHCRIARHSVFARKHYFYPDLPKGYQISQFEQPICKNGYVDIATDEQVKRIGLTRIHLEEDAGKSVHAEEFVDDDETLIDLNRCGVPLIEVVTEPDMRTPVEAAAFLNELRQVVQYLEICDGNMEQGSLRCDANVSVREAGRTNLGTKTELKNMNSISGVEKALEFEIKRQSRIVEQGGEVVQQTLLWNDDKNAAFPMRDKEESHDYRYFPDPDLLPVEIEDSLLEEVKQSLPELPRERRERFVRQYAIPHYDAEILTSMRPLADYFEDVALKTKDAKLASNWIMGDVLRQVKSASIEIQDFPIKPASLAELLLLFKNGTINRKIARAAFAEMIETGKSADEIIQLRGWSQISNDDEIAEHIKSVLEQNSAEASKFLEGNEQVFGFLVGQVMRLTRGKANPAKVNEILRKELEAISKK